MRILFWQKLHCWIFPLLIFDNLYFCMNTSPIHADCVIKQSAPELPTHSYYECAPMSRISVSLTSLVNDLFRSFFPKNQTFCFTFAHSENQKHRNRKNSIIKRDIFNKMAPPDPAQVTSARSSSIANRTENPMTNRRGPPIGPNTSIKVSKLNKMM